ncbi:MAG: hypothetical protein K5696_01320 [Lachnospiraceae bacterium]|nr:hypothetical protein [Lachnospiraceae bacterium]
MGRRILFISKAETFIVKGLEAKLKGIGTDPDAECFRAIDEKLAAMDWDAILGILGDST